MQDFIARWWIRASAILVVALAAPRIAAALDCFEIQVVDDQTGRGVPLAEVRMVNHFRQFTDSAGRVAFCEPGLWGKTVFFHIGSQGYEMPKDGFGFAGVRIQLKPGGKEVIKLKRRNIAERLYRVTGEGIYRDTVLLGHEPPIEAPLLNGLVLGQDSVQPVIYRGKIYWFWGDTEQLSYPLGNFRTSGAVSELPEEGGLNPSEGVNLNYFTDEKGFSKKMCPFEPKEGVVWIDGPLTVRDEKGGERLLTHWTRLLELGKPVEHGLAVFNDKQEIFERLTTLDLEEKWRFPHGHPFVLEEGVRRFFYFGNSFPNVRVKADLNAVLDPGAYEAWSCLAGGVWSTEDNPKLNRNGDGELVYRWTTHALPTGPKEEKALIEQGLMKREEAHFQPVDVESDKLVQMHGGTVRWNPWRKRWVLIAVEIGGSSLLGEVWYSEAKAPTGPWKKARKIATHDRYDFYNPAHHEFFDQEGGRVIYFEGTYVNTFSGNPDTTPRYNYNQIMYRLDLDDERLRAVWED